LFPHVLVPLVSPARKALLAPQALPDHKVNPVRPQWPPI
jgi:hypothetical protein